jgi:hypothetical protein
MKNRMTASRENALLAAVVLCVLGAARPVQATLVEPTSEQDLFQKAELIFEGTVTRIESRLSDRRSDQDDVLPHTFITFRIHRTYKGAAQNKNDITLRFTGGPGRGERFLEVVGVPRFEIGEKCILFVTGNGMRICPIVGWGQGLFRVVDNVVLTENGRSIWRTKDGLITYGPVDAKHWRPRTPRPGQPTIKTVSIEPADSVSGRDAPPKGSGREGGASLGERLDRSALLDYIRDGVAAYNTPEGLKALAPVRSADIAAPFYVPKSKPVEIKIAR